jgi:hypothetical protein
MMNLERKLRWMQRAMIAQFFVVLSLVALQGSYQNVAWKQLSYDASGNLQIAAPSGKAVVFSQGLRTANGYGIGVGTTTPTTNGIDFAASTVGYAFVGEASMQAASETLYARRGAASGRYQASLVIGSSRVSSAAFTDTGGSGPAPFTQGATISTGKSLAFANTTALTGSTGTEGLSVSQAVVTTQLILVEVADPGAAAANTVRLFTDSTSDDVMANFDAGSVTVATKP